MSVVLRSGTIGWPEWEVATVTRDEDSKCELPCKRLTTAVLLDMASLRLRSPAWCREPCSTQILSATKTQYCAFELRVAYLRKLPLLEQPTEAAASCLVYADDPGSHHVLSTLTTMQIATGTAARLSPWRSEYIERILLDIITELDAARFTPLFFRLLHTINSASSYHNFIEIRRIENRPRCV